MFAVNRSKCWIAIDSYSLACTTVSQALRSNALSRESRRWFYLIGSAFSVSVAKGRTLLGSVDRLRCAQVASVKCTDRLSLDVPLDGSCTVEKVSYISRWIVSLQQIQFGSLLFFGTSSVAIWIYSNVFFGDSFIFSLFCLASNFNHFADWSCSLHLFRKSIKTCGNRLKIQISSMVS